MINYKRKLQKKIINITEDIESMEHEGSLFFEKKEKKIQKTKKSSWNLKI